MDCVTQKKQGALERGLVKTPLLDQRQAQFWVLGYNVRRVSRCQPKKQLGQKNGPYEGRDKGDAGFRQGAEYSSACLYFMRQDGT